MKTFITDLRANLKNSKPKYAEIVRDTKAFNEEAEELVKAAIKEVKQSLG